MAQTFTLGENYVINSSTLNAVRFAYNRTDIHRTSTDFFSAPDVGINIYSYMPHYMLLNVTGGFQLGGGTESQSDVHHAVVADQRRPDARARRSPVRIRRHLRALDVAVAGQRAVAGPVHGRRHDHRPRTRRLHARPARQQRARPGGAEHARHGRKVIWACTRRTRGGSVHA